MKFISIILILFLPFSAYSEDKQESEKMTVYGSKIKRYLQSQSNSTINLSEDDLKHFQYTDIEKVLDSIPGIVLQTEDGFGLRPNIGIRGVNPHRSKKICLMEDDILIAPAPYSAPAAYYFPSMAFTKEIDVKKGPSATVNGPNNIAGSINMKTIDPPLNNTTEIKAESGSFQEKNLTLSHGNTIQDWGYLIGINHHTSDGFKELNSGESTGFNKNDSIFKLQKQINGSEYQHLINLKLRYGNEKSHETYLGTTKADYERSPYHRYTASSKDLMTWEHQAIKLGYLVESSEETWKINLYENKFHRVWDKFNGFGDKEISIDDVLLSPNKKNEYYLHILKGEEDSAAIGGSDDIILGKNERYYSSQGISLNYSKNFISSTSRSNKLNLGLRYHQDNIKREHSETSYLMFADNLDLIDNSKIKVTTNKDHATSIAGFATFQWNKGKWSVTPGFRFESINNSHKDLLNSEKETIKNQEDLFGPSLGIQFYAYEDTILFMGAYKGFSPTGPGQEIETKPEESTNYELGVNYNRKYINNTSVIFYNDYKNIKGVCSFSSGCGTEKLDNEFNGGTAKVYGLEESLKFRIPFNGWFLFNHFNYTYTFAAFTSSHESLNPEWGLGTIKNGSPLPYIPDHKISDKLGFEEDHWSFYLQVNHTGRRFNQSVKTNRLTLNSFTLFHLSTDYKFNEDVKIHFKVENIDNKKYVSSLRPYGYRPGKPRSFHLGGRLIL